MRVKQAKRQKYAASPCMQELHSLFTARCVSRYSVAPDWSCPVTITTWPPPQSQHWHIQNRTKSTNPCVNAPKDASGPASAYGSVAFFKKNPDKYGSLQQRGLTWDVDVPSFMIREFTPVPLSRRNIRLFHQKGPRHAQLIRTPLLEVCVEADFHDVKSTKSYKSRKLKLEGKKMEGVGPLFSFLLAPFFSFRKRCAALISFPHLTHLYLNLSSSGAKKKKKR